MSEKQINNGHAISEFLASRGLAGERFKPVWCVYFLMKAGELIYVGHSSNVGLRIGTHNVAGFDEVWFVECESREHALIIELDAAKLFLPMKNRNLIGRPERERRGLYSPTARSPRAPLRQLKLDLAIGKRI